MADLKVLLIGNGGREHALAIALAKDETVTELHVAPGNPGTASVVLIGAQSNRQPADHSQIPKKAQNHPTDAHGNPFNAEDPQAVVTLAQQLEVNLVVIGPEAPLVAGVADAVRKAGIPCFGPNKSAAEIEGSKAFAKDIMLQAGVPTAKAYYCQTLDEVAQALDEFGPTYVVKADGLAAGKGVIVTDDRQAALDHAQVSLPVIVEEYLDGPEVSLFAITDGQHCLPLLPAQDFKRVGDGDAGPNTGGMGAYTPLPWAPDGLVDAIMARVVQPTVNKMAELGKPFVGLLYAGLALTSRGLRVVEFNCRFGDPETQAVLSMLRTGLGQVLYAAATGNLDQIKKLDWHDGAAVIVVSAATGYPGTPKKGGAISGPLLSDVSASTGSESGNFDAQISQSQNDFVHIVHAGTKLDDDGILRANGGRVLGTVARGADLAEARMRAYQAISELDFPDGFNRTDIALKAAEGRIPTPKLD